MRKEQFTIDSYVHVLNRGTKKLPIVRDDQDRKRFIKSLFYLNDEYVPENWSRELSRLDIPLFQRPSTWRDRQPIVSILAYNLMDNHFHLLLKEIKDGGISRFMHKLGTSMTNSFNLRHKETGSIFQGAYKARMIDDDNYFRYVCVYIMIKNAFERYPGGLGVAISEFDKAYDFALRDMFYSSGEYFQGRNFSIVEKKDIEDIFETPTDFKMFARECMLGVSLDEILGDLTMEDKAL